MATLSWLDVVLIGLVATVGFTLLSFWFSAIMTRKGWTYQMKPKARKAEAKASRDAGEKA